MKKGKFDFEDYLKSMKQMRNMGGISSILGMLPGMNKQMGDIESMIDEKQMNRMEAIVLSMTPEERQNRSYLIQAENIVLQKVVCGYQCSKSFHQTV